MADWQRTLDISNSWELVSEGEITYQELAKEIAYKLNLLKPFSNKYDTYIDYRKNELIEEFEILAEEEDDIKDELNYTISCLYDWGDFSLDDKFGGKKVCWIRTF